MRNNMYTSGIERVSQILSKEGFSGTEIIKYLNYIGLLRFKLKNRGLKLKNYLSKNMQYLLTEYNGIEKMSGND